MKGMRLWLLAPLLSAGCVYEVYHDWDDVPFTNNWHDTADMGLDTCLPPDTADDLSDTAVDTPDAPDARDVDAFCEDQAMVAGEVALVSVTLDGADADEVVSILVSGDADVEDFAPASDGSLLVALRVPADAEVNVTLVLELSDGTLVVVQGHLAVVDAGDAGTDPCE